MNGFTDLLFHLKHEFPKVLSPSREAPRAHVRLAQKAADMGATNFSDCENKVPSCKARWRPRSSNFRHLSQRFSPKNNSDGALPFSLWKRPKSRPLITLHVSSGREFRIRSVRRELGYFWPAKSYFGARRTNRLIDQYGSLLKKSFHSSKELRPRRRSLRLH